MLDTEGWFARVHDHDGGEDNIDGVCIPKFRPGTFIWGTSPGVSIIVIEELHQSPHNRTDSAHIFIAPRLLWHDWQIHMPKSEDITLDIPAGSGYIWPQEMHETLILAIYFPYLDRFMWELKWKILLVGVGRHLWGVLKNNHSMKGGGVLCHNFFSIWG